VRVLVFELGAVGGGSLAVEVAEAIALSGKARVIRSRCDWKWSATSGSNRSMGSCRLPLMIAVALNLVLLRWLG
jgi:hypothetical protein